MKFQLRDAWAPLCLVILIIKMQPASKAANVLHTKEKPFQQWKGFVMRFIKSIKGIRGLLEQEDP